MLLLMTGVQGFGKNKLYYGDNLDVLREHIAEDSVDLIYLDPPFNSDRIHNVLFQEKSGADSPPQIQAFDDTWTWSQDTETLYRSALDGQAPLEVAMALEAMLRMLGDTDLMAYLVMMTSRLLELRRVLRPTGSLFLHCDPTASHYLKMICDAVFGSDNFRNEIIWQRTQAKSLMTHRLPSNHDVILAYGKTDRALWNENALFQPYDINDPDPTARQKYSNRDAEGRLYQLTSLINPNPDRPNLTYEFLGVTRVWRWNKERMQEAYNAGLVVQTAPGRVPRLKRYLDEQRGKPLGDVWSDIPPLNARAAERLGYPTQKPVKLLERIVAAASQPGDVVLDPFAGCGTTIDAAQRLDRQWLGIDITTLAIELIDARLRHTYSESIRETYEILGIPRDLDSAKAMFKRSPFEFERWCVMQVDGQPNEKQIADRGVDGVIRIPIDAKANSHRVLVSVKGGSTNPGKVRDLLGAIELQGASMGLFVTLNPPTSGMIEIARRSGIYTYPVNNEQYPKLQIITVAELLNGVRPDMPTPLIPYFQARRWYADAHEQMMLS
jgi:DNA modification methylase